RHYVVRSHRPEFLNELHALFLGLGEGGLASFDGVLDVADALIGKLNKTDIGGHSACSFREVFLKGYCRFASAQKIRMENRIASKLRTPKFLTRSRPRSLTLAPRVLQSMSL